MVSTATAGAGNETEYEDSGGVSGGGAALPLASGWGDFGH